MRLSKEEQDEINELMVKKEEYSKEVRKYQSQINSIRSKAHKEHGESMVGKCFSDNENDTLHLYRIDSYIAEDMMLRGTVLSVYGVDDMSDGTWLANLELNEHIYDHKIEVSEEVSSEEFNEKLNWFLTLIKK